MDWPKNRIFTKQQLEKILKNIKGKTLGDIDKCQIIMNAKPNNKGIAGCVVEQSVLGYEKDNQQECDILVDYIPTEVKTTGLKVPLRKYVKLKKETGSDYNKYLRAKEPLSITGVTLNPSIEIDFKRSCFYEKISSMLFVYYEYKAYNKNEKVTVKSYADFPVVSYQFHKFEEFSTGEQMQLQKDWEIVRDFLEPYYKEYSDSSIRNKKLERFTSKLRGQLLLIDLSPAFSIKKDKKKKQTAKCPSKVSYNLPRYRFKKTFLDQIVIKEFSGSKVNDEVELEHSFDSFLELDKRCTELTKKYKDLTLSQLKEIFHINAKVTGKNFTEQCVLHMFDANCKRLNKIKDFTRAGIIAKTITLTKDCKRTEDMKLFHIDFEEWNKKNVRFKDSDVYTYFYEHSFLCPIFLELNKKDSSKTIFKGFKRLSFEATFINKEVKQTWKDSRTLVHEDKLRWEYVYKKGVACMNKSGTYKGAPNFPKSDKYVIFFRGSQVDSSAKSRSECVNGIQMLPQWIWIKGTYIVERLGKIKYICIE